ncbi:MAG: riboflavin synthase [Blastocatellia bacterium]|jgi:riboflavin synthase
MFTGIIEELGVVRSLVPGQAGARIEISAGRILEGTRIGDSIAVNGVCLTAVALGSHSFRADLSAETVRRTSLQSVSSGTSVNLERALTPTTRMGGHLVQGHVDATGHWLEAQPSGNGWVLRIAYPPELGRYFVEKGSVAVDGISLTIARLTDQWFEIAVIPQTWRATNLQTRGPGAVVNLEVDIIAKYVERMLDPRLPSSPKREGGSLTLEQLQDWGY